MKMMEFLLLLFACVLSAVTGSENHLLTAPHPNFVEMGTNFSATCTIVDTNEVTANDLFWKMSNRLVPREQYTRINSTALNVTLQVRGEEDEWLFCQCAKVSATVILNQGKFTHGIFLKKAYPPRRPENVTCIALQDDSRFSKVLNCSWKAPGPQTASAPTVFTLYVKTSSDTFNSTTVETFTPLTMKIFPNFNELVIWVEASNGLGSTESEVLTKDAGFFVKTDAPKNVKILCEKNFSTSFLVRWTRPIISQYLSTLTYEIRLCQTGAHHWDYVPRVDTARDIEDFRIQNLQPDSVYVVQVRCKNHKEGYGYWSEWSTNATTRTPEDSEYQHRIKYMTRPAGESDVWRIISEGQNVINRSVQIVCKPPVVSNGRIIRFDLKIQEEKDKVKNGSWRNESFPVNGSDVESERRSSFALATIPLDDRQSVKVQATASNSVGDSSVASLFIPARAHERPPVENMRVWSEGGQMLVQWEPPHRNTVTEYVVEWVEKDKVEWQREHKASMKTVIKGELTKYVAYLVSVYPMYSGWTGRASTQKAYLEQAAPREGPVIRLNGKPGHNEAELVWEELPESERRGFITNYTISYTSGDVVHTVVVPPDATSYTLTSLTGNTKYDTWISASTIAGSTKGFSHSFTTLKYASGEIELIVVGSSLFFLVVVCLSMALCVYKREAIKRNFWPQIPNPRESTIGNWSSPDYQLKTETPKENCLSGISVLDVDDGRTSFDEDKTSLPLKKDKYLSEEHSSGIGGSSCMSSPRQSVSDSDEGGDMADTTASTVQYSSVVASSGYKGQTPSSQPQAAIFSRSESTQPLLDCEENPDTSVQDSGSCGRQAQRFFRRPAADDPAHFNQLLEMEQQEALDFCPLEEDSEQTPTEEQGADWQPSASSYMPQLGGYRQQ